METKTYDGSDEANCGNNQPEPTTKTATKPTTTQPTTTRKRMLYATLVATRNSFLK